MASPRASSSLKVFPVKRGAFTQQVTWRVDDAGESRLQGFFSKIQYEYQASPANV